MSLNAWSFARRQMIAFISPTLPTAGLVWLLPTVTYLTKIVTIASLGRDPAKHPQTLCAMSLGSVLGPLSAPTPRQIPMTALNNARITRTVSGGPTIPVMDSAYSPETAQRWTTVTPAFMDKESANLLKERQRHLAQQNLRSLPQPYPQQKKLRLRTMPRTALLPQVRVERDKEIEHPYIATGLESEKKSKLNRYTVRCTRSASCCPASR